MKKLEGIIVPLVTPLKDRDSLDVEGLEKLIAHVIDGGVHGIFILGTSGEMQSLSYRLKRELMERSAKLIAGRVPLLAGISDTSFVETVHLAKHAADTGADGLVLTAPYYFPAGQTELISYVDHLMPQLPLPVMLYNMPSLTKVWFEQDSLKRLSGHPGIIGLKDSSGDMDYFRSSLALKEQRPDWTFFVGPEHLLEDCLKMGGDGGVNGGANVFPEIFSQTYEAIRSGDTSKAHAGMMRIAAWQSAYDIGKYASRHIKAMKCGLSLLGVCDDFMAEPFKRFNPPEQERVASVLKRVQSLEGPN